MSQLPDSDPVADKIIHDDKRRIQRVPVRVVVSSGGRSAPLGETRDMSLHGVFVTTSDPLPVGGVLPLAIDLGAGGELRVKAEVVRHADRGMGLKFIELPRAQARRLRRFINKLTSVEDALRVATELHAPDRQVEPIRDPVRVAAKLDQTREAGVDVALIPCQRLVRDRATLIARGPDRLTLRTADRSLLEVGEEVFALATVDFHSYSFTAKVLAVEGRELSLSLPRLLVYSERRDHARVTPPAEATIRWPAPWDPRVWISYPVSEHSEGGLSFRIAEADCQLVPGTPLSNARLVIDGVESPLEAPEVKHITRIEEADGSAWLRVGVSHGPARGHTTVASVKVHDLDKGSPLQRFQRRVSKLSDAVSYVMHLGRKRIASAARVVPARKVRFRSGPHDIVGLLDRTFADGERPECPLVIIVPGFGGRKEQMSFLANTLVDGFRRNHADLAVLRIDGTNNLGESGKDPGCEAEGHHTMRYTISGTVRDVLACLEWARHNDYVVASHVILTSFSMSSIAVRHVLTRADTGAVGLWVSYMGAADTRDALKHVSGNLLDIFERAPDEPLGVCSLVGCLTDGDNFVDDLERLQLGRLDDAKREMAKIRADVLWLMGLHDAYMDPRRVRELMSVKAPGRRDIIEVDSGHLPTTGDEAIKQFVLITRRVWQHVHRSPMADFRPSLGRIAVIAAAEWELVRQARPLADRRAWWRGYLLESGALGFDLLEYAPAYASFMDAQAAALDVTDKEVLELGAGTGNLTHRLAAAGPRRLVATDFVPEALDRLRGKLPAGAPVEVRRVDLDGSPLLALRRWISGDLAGPQALSERLPAVQRASLTRLLEGWDDPLHAALTGRAVDVGQLAAARRLSGGDARLLADLNLLARAVRGHVDLATAREGLGLIPASALDPPHGLPFADASFDVVAMSLVLSYLDHPEDILWEIHRVLRPGGSLLISSMRRDTDSSKLYLELIDLLERLPSDQIPAGLTREEALDSAHAYADAAAELQRLEEEGFFTFYDPDELVGHLLRRGFIEPAVTWGWGQPPQAVIVTCRRG